MGEPVFKVYEQRQGMLLPPGYEELVPMNHPVRVVDEVIERIDVSALGGETRARQWLREAA